MRAVIVDDEPLAREGVLIRLGKFQDIEVVAECEDGSSAIEKITELSPDLVFLDVQMPDMDGFEVLRALPQESLPEVIFLTAYEHHAVRAFEVNALDYLLKPVDDDRFAAAIERARNSAHSDSKLEMADRLLQLLKQESRNYVTRFPVRVGPRIQVVRANDIDWIAAAGDYVELHGKGRSHLLHETMNSVEHKLDPKEFLRIHRSRIVRLELIEEARNIDNREYLVRLSDGSEHRSGRTYAGRVEAWLTSGNTTLPQNICRLPNCPSATDVVRSPARLPMLHHRFDALGKNNP
jgi:two-component system, LytTR family, response regulator